MKNKINRRLKNMKGYIVLAVAVGILLLSDPIIAVNGGGSVQQENIAPPEVEAIVAPSTAISGEIFEGDYLRIGINNAGSLGVSGPPGTGPGGIGVGFQSVGDTPFVSPSTESAAIAFWGEGYNIAYKEREKKKLVDTVAWYQPSLGGFPPSPATNIVPVSEKLIINDTQKAVKEIKVRTKDKKLLITFTFTFLKKYPELNLETTIMNVGTVPVRDVVYKRIVDWDVCADTNGFINNFASTGHEAYAWGQCDALKNPLPVVNDKTVQLTIAGHDGAFKTTSKKLDIPLPIVSYVDLFAWDDMTIRSPGNVVQSFVPIADDFNTAVYYKIGELKPRESKTVYTVYQSNFPKSLSEN